MTGTPQHPSNSISEVECLFRRFAMPSESRRRSTAAGGEN